MEIYRTTLSCGARFFGVPVLDIKGRIASGIHIPYGSAHDPARISGVHHFGEHLFFKSEENEDRTKFAFALEDAGAEYNADTQSLSTSVYNQVFREDLNLGASHLIALVGRRPEFSPRQLGVERRVVLEEMGVYNDDPNTVVYDMGQEQMYLPPHSRSAIGTIESVEGITGADILDLWIGSYHPREFIIGVVGSLDFEDFARVFDTRLSEVSPHIREGWQPRTREDFVGVRTGSWRTRINEGLDRCHIGFSIPLSGLSREEFTASEIVAEYLTGGFVTSKLFYEIRERRGLCYQVNGWTYYQRGKASYLIYTCTDTENANKVISLIRDGIESVQDITPEILLKTKGKLKKRLRGLYDSPLEYLEYFLECEGNGLGIDSFFKAEEDIDKTTLEQVLRVGAFQVQNISVLSPCQIEGMEKLGIPNFLESN